MRAIDVAGGQRVALLPNLFDAAQTDRDDEHGQAKGYNEPQQVQTHGSPVTEDIKLRHEGLPLASLLWTSDAKPP